MIYALSYEPEVVCDYLFYIFFKNQSAFDTNKTYFIENNPKLPLLRTFSFIFSEVDKTLKIRQNLIRLISNNEIPIIEQHDERFHAILAEIIRAHLAKNPNENPTNILPHTIICHNNTINKTQGLTLYKLLFGHIARRVPENTTKKILC